MKSIAARLTGAVCLCAAMTFIAGCNEDDPPVQPDPCAGVTTLEIVQPQANATLTVGVAASIAWCLPLGVEGVVVQYSPDDGETWITISEGEAIFGPVTSLQWTPQQNHVSTVGVIRVANYTAQGSHFTVVGPLTVAAGN